MQIVDSLTLLNSYAHVEGQSRCCSASMNESECREQPSDGSECCDKPNVEALPLVSCCSYVSTDLRSRLSDLLARYDVNDYAASVKDYAIWTNQVRTEQPRRHQGMRKLQYCQ